MRDEKPRTSSWAWKESGFLSFGSRVMIHAGGGHRRLWRDQGPQPAFACYFNAWTIVSTFSRIIPWKVSPAEPTGPMESE